MYIMHYKQFTNKTRTNISKEVLCISCNKNERFTNNNRAIYIKRSYMYIMHYKQFTNTTRTNKSKEGTCISCNKSSVISSKLYRNV